jgi:hypothetical protein
VLYGQRVLGVVRVVDVPAAGRGRRYIIERGLTSMAELEAIVADYLQQAAVWDRGPGRGRCACSRSSERRDEAARPRSAREFSERDLLIATLVGRYVERRERGDAPCAHDLLAVAAEHGDSAVAELRDVLAF